MATWKRLILVGIGVGLGLALVLSAVFAGFEWYSSRPRPWDDSSVVAKFHDLWAEEDALVYSYSVENRSNEDWKLAEGGFRLVDKYNSPPIVSSSTSDATIVGLPATIPAKEAAWLLIVEARKANLKTKPREKGHFEELKRYMKTEIPNFGGFVIYDDARKYRVDLPNGWSEDTSPASKTSEKQQ